MNAQEPKRKRSGSQKRRVTAQIKLNMLPAQKEEIVSVAQAHGHSPSELALNALLGVPLPARTFRSRVKEKAIGQLLSEMQKWRGELNMIGSNLNQIAHHLNAGRPGDTVEGILESTLRELIQALERDLTEMRTGVMEVLGLEGERGSRATEEDP